MNKSIATRTAALLAAATLTTGVTIPRPASAVDYIDFPNTDGSWKILSPAAWGGSVPTDECPRFDGANNRTYYIDRDGSLKGMYVDYASAWNSRTSTFQFQNGAKLTLGGSIEGGTRSLGNSSSHNDWRYIVFKDGTMDFNGNGLVKNEQSANWVNILFAGCTVTNVNNVWMPSAHQDLLTISNCTLWVNNTIMPSYAGGMTGVRIVIKDGSKVSAGQFTMSRTYNGGPIGTHTDGVPLMDVCGGGTELVIRGVAPSPYSKRNDDSVLDDEAAKGRSFLVSLGSGEIFRIGDGAKVTVGGRAIIGIKKGANNRIIVEGAGSELTIGEHVFAYSGNVTTGSTNNCIVVRDGGKLVSGTVIRNEGSGAGNGVICSNGVVITRGPKYYNNVTSNRLNYRMQGDNPLISFVADNYSEGAYLACGINWVFDLPAGGYRAGCVPFQFNSQQFLRKDANSSNLTCEINGLSEFCQDMRDKGDIRREITLIGGSGSFKSGTGKENEVTVEYSRDKYEEAVARWNTELQTKVPQGFSASLVRSGMSVTLDVKRILATVISLH